MGDSGQGRFESKQAAFDRLLDTDAGVERLATGFKFTEGPVWVAAKACLLFSDIPANQIWSWSESGGAQVFREPSGNSNGLTVDREGRLLACEHGNRRVSRTESDGAVVALAHHYGGKRLNSPNDLVVRSDGMIYFTDPPYGIRPEQQEQPVQGVYRMGPGGEELALVADDFLKPNGLAFSPDEKKLYVDDSGRRHLRSFEVTPAGALTGGSIFADMDVEEKGSPDGMKVDTEGNLYVTGPGGLWVFNPAGAHLGMIVTPERPANCAWGETDGCSLYVTAQTSLYRVRVRVPGIALP